MNDPVGPRQFVATHWSLVRAARLDEASRTRASEPLEELCCTWWYPLYTASTPSRIAILSPGGIVFVDDALW